MYEPLIIDKNYGNIIKIVSNETFEIKKLKTNDIQI